MRYVLVSPAYHRLHHDRDDRRGVNLGTVLVLWDVLAGLAVVPTAVPDVAATRERGSELVRTGLAGRPLPVEQEPGAGLVRTMGSQLWSPVRSGVAADPVELVERVEPQAVERVRVPVLAGASNG